MDKVELEFKTPIEKTIEYNNIPIVVKPFLNFSEQILLIRNYLEDYFGNVDSILIEQTSHHYLEAEFRLMNYIIQLNTNIDMSTPDNEIYVNDKLWDKIVSEISNYYEFRARLEAVLQEAIREETLKNSIGKVLSDLIEKANGFIDKFGNMNPDDIEKMGKTGLELIERLEKSSVLGSPSDVEAIVESAISPKKGV